MSQLLIRNAKLYTQGNTPVDCVVQDGRVAFVGERAGDEYSWSDDDIIDAHGMTLIPGLIDMHVHFRVPGGEYKEDWQTGSAAALAGGVTTVCDMPNNDPAITTRELLEKKIAMIQPVAGVDFGCYIGATNDNVAEIVASADIACGVKVYHGASTGNMLMNDPTILKELFQAGLSIPIVIHAEDEATIEKNTERYKTYSGADIHGKIRSRDAAIRSLTEVLELAHGTRVKLHITHVSTQEELELIRQAKQENYDITCDVTPHHLAFSQEDVKRLGHRLRVNPPIRDAADVEALWEGIYSGVVDMIGTDHAPHTREEKEGTDYWKVPSGVPGVETLLPFLLDRLSDRFTIQRLVELTSTHPAQRFGFAGKGVVEKGAIADLVIVDLNGKTTIDRTTLKTKCGWSPWEGVEFRGAVQQVIRHGKVVGTD